MTAPGVTLPPRSRCQRRSPERGPVARDVPECIASCIAAGHGDTAATVGFGAAWTAAGAETDAGVGSVTPVESHADVSPNTATRTNRIRRVRARVTAEPAGLRVI